MLIGKLLQSSSGKSSLICLKTEGSRLGAGLPHCHCLLIGISAGLSISQGACHLAVLGQVEGGDLLGLLNLLLVGLTLPCSWSMRACMRSWFFLSSSAAKVSSLILRSDLRRFLEASPWRLDSASSSDSSSRMRVSILIMPTRE